MRFLIWLHAIYPSSNSDFRQGLSALLLALGLVATVAVLPASADTGKVQTAPVPLLAYYYIGHEVDSWNKGDADVPLAGRYSSDDVTVMREHVRLAKQAGIDGFIVTWRKTSRLNQRLERLIEIADGEDFKLAINYQALDAQNNPIAASKIAADLDYFVRHYTGHAAFTLFGKPIIIWSGIWEYSEDDIALVSDSREDDLLLLASARSIDEYQRVARYVSGNAYYWSSVDPDSSPGYRQKLIAMGEAAHSDHELWIAPAAPGYRSPSGGERTVRRFDGATLRQQLEAAMGSSPDAVGLISWNVFTDDTHVEPSVNDGGRSLDVVAEVRNAARPAVIDFDSSEPGDTQFRPASLATLGGMALLFIASLGAIALRSLRGM